MRLVHWRKLLIRTHLHLKRGSPLLCLLDSPLQHLQLDLSTCRPLRCCLSVSACTLKCLLCPLCPVALPALPQMQHTLLLTR